MTFQQLYTIIKNRRKNMPKGSYVASLLREGNDRIIQKVGEEAVEVIIAAKNEEKAALLSEVTDLFFHVVILLVSYDLTLEEIYTILERRTHT